MKRIAIGLIVLASAGATLTAESPQQAFVKAWDGRAVVVRTTLYSLVYNERGKLGNLRSGVREGLIVATPSKGNYYQFNGRQGRDAVVESDLQRVVASINTAYEADSLEVRSYRKVEPLAIQRYDRGVELVVSGVRVDRDEIRLDFAPADGGQDPVTSVRIKWPTPWSKSFSERALVEDLVGRFVEIKPL